MPPETSIRNAVDSDLPSILEIYNDAVRNTTAIWNETVVDLKHRHIWCHEKVAKAHPVLVAERDGEVIGCSTYGVWRTIGRFRATMEHSVYVRTDRKGTGAGSMLMRGIIPAAESNGVHVLVADVEAGNTVSIRLHEKRGFRMVRTFAQVGRKFDRWLDLTCMELRFGS